MLVNNFDPLDNSRMSVNRSYLVMRNRQTDAKKMGEFGNRTMNYNPREYPIDQLLKASAINASQKSQKNSLPSKKLSLDQIQKTH